MSRATGKAFTLAELVLAVSITAVIGLAVAGVAAALSHAHSHTDAMNNAIQSGRRALLHVEAAIRKAKLVGGIKEGQLVLWMGDLNNDRRINLGELALVQHLPGAGTIEHWQLAFPGDLSASMLELLNAPIALAEIADPQVVREKISGVMYTDYLSMLVLATEVEAFAAVGDKTPPLCRLVLLRVTVAGPDQRIELTSAARLRADALDSVRVVGGVPVLDLD